MSNKDLTKYKNDYLHDSGYEAVIADYRRRKVIEYLKETGAKNILEVGCGVKSVAEEYRNFSSFTIVEPIQKFLKTCEKRLEKATAKRSGQQTKFVLGFVEDNIKELKKKKYDFIILSSLLHEVSDPIAFLKIIKVLATAKTKVLVIVPNSESLHNRLAVHMGILKRIGEISKTGEKFQRVSTFNSSLLNQTLSRSGFMTKKTETFFLKPFSNAQMVALFREKILTENILDAFYDISSETPGLGLELLALAQVKK